MPSMPEREPMIEDDCQDDDVPCPKCGHHETRSRRCTNIGCEDGYVDEHDSDPVNYARGEEMEFCPECRGYEIIRWCLKCGADYWRALEELTPEARKAHQAKLLETE